jgi:hypothetical protein
MTNLTVACGGVSDCLIVIPRGRSAAIDYAAAELQQLLAGVTGVTLPVVGEDADRHGPALLLGPCDTARPPSSCLESPSRYEPVPESGIG